MKTVIKYELTINKAMRSALSYGTPDEQIDEFIRYLGRHIGADRIYIFEDCPKKNITKNTYEWCADGVKPEIDNLQNVPMELIGWWYDLFEQKKNVIIDDMEDIKETHPGVPTFPCPLVNALLTLAAVRLVLSVSASTIIAIPLGP